MRNIIDTETGEVVGVIYDGDRIVRAKSVEGLLEFEKIPEGETFTKMYHSIIPQLVDSDLSAASLIVLMHLAVNLRYRSNVAKYSNGRLITRSNLQTDLKLSEPTIKRSICSLIRSGLVVEANTIEGKVFVVNPYVVNMGDKINKTVFDLFRKTKWARW